MEEKIAELNPQKEQLEKIYGDEIKLLDKKKKQVSEESSKLQNIVKEKEKVRVFYFFLTNRKYVLTICDLKR